MKKFKNFTSASIRVKGLCTPIESCLTGAMCGKCSIFKRYKPSKRTCKTLVDSFAGDWAVRDVATMTWALGMLEESHMGFLEACRQLVAPRLHSATGRDLANLLWGFARLQISLPAIDVYTVSGIPSLSS